MNKKNKEEQKYEKYWSLTLEYSDIYGDNFNRCLNTIVNFIDENSLEIYSETKYKNLQKIIGTIFKKVDSASTRKSINQFVKLGFIYPKLEGYPRETKEFLTSKTDEMKRTIFSKIIYSYSSFNSSVTEKTEEKEMNFLVKTLENVNSLTKEQLSVLMQIDVAKVSKGYYTEDELNEELEEGKSFYTRKYNQVNFLWGISKKLDGIYEENSSIFLLQEDRNILDGEEIKKGKIRDSYSQRLYKNKLKQEAKEVLGEVACMVTSLPYDKLIASHIKPFRNSSPEEEYAINNGILLSLDLDQLFDFGKISFDNRGKIIYSKVLSEKIVKHIERNNWKLTSEFLNSERLDYLDYHRKNIFKGGSE